VSSLDQAVQTQLRNIETKTGRTLDQLREALAATGLTKHGQLRDWAKAELGLGHGDANTLVHLALASDGTSAARAAGASVDEVLDGIYVGPKAAMRPIHDAVMAAANGLGDFEVLPKKGYVSLRRKKQFAMVGPATNTRFEVGLNMKGVEGTERLVAQAPGGMCQYKVVLAGPEDVDGAFAGWLREAYEQAG